MTTLMKNARQLSGDEKTLIKEAFNLLDTDQNGYLDYHETKAAMRALGLSAKKVQVMNIMRTYDPPNGNKIGYEDFYFVVSNKIANRNPIDEFKYAFKLFTSDTNTGKITFQDLKAINEKSGSGLTDDEMRSMIDEFAMECDGAINEAEFMEIMIDAED